MRREGYRIRETTVKLRVTLSDAPESCGLLRLRRRLLGWRRRCPRRLGSRRVGRRRLGNRFFLRRRLLRWLIVVDHNLSWRRCRNRRLRHFQVASQSKDLRFLHDDKFSIRSASCFRVPSNPLRSFDNDCRSSFDRTPLRSPPRFQHIINRVQMAMARTWPAGLPVQPGAVQ